MFPCALIAGDVVILELLAKLDYLKTGKVAVAFIDTFHLFPETITFLKQLEVCCAVALLPAFSVNGQHLHITELHKPGAKGMSLSGALQQCSHSTAQCTHVAF